MTPPAACPLCGTPLGGPAHTRAHTKRVLEYIKAGLCVPVRLPVQHRDDRKEDDDAEHDA